MCIKIIKEFILECNVPVNEEQIKKLSDFHECLFHENQYVNLISRKSSSEDFWLRHVLDSLLILKKRKFSEETILDFGTGGGLPGIPLKIIFPGIKMYLLDSRERKINAIKKILKKLDLKQCFTITSRIEELDRTWDGYFDVVLSRSVRQERRYKEKMTELTGSGGMVYLYKSMKLDDIKIFSNYEVINVSHPLVGTRNLIEIKL